MMDAFDLASRLFGNSRAESRGDVSNSLDILTATGAGDSSDGAATVYIDADVTPADDYDGDDYAIGIPTSPNVIEGDGVLVGLTGSGPLKTPVVISNPGWGDSIQTQVDNAETLAQQAAEDVEQVRQDVADFRDDVATTYATKVERQDGDDAVKTWVTTNYTNSNDLATTYATKTLVSQTKDAIELAASQTYETQTDAAATYATKAALTVGLNGIRTEVAEDYQPKGDYATTASMNSAIQQSASSIESSVAATYETKSDAAATYATKTEVQQTASGLDTRITTAQSTADGAYLERTATGTAIDTTGAATIRSLVVEGQSVQDGTPSPSAPVPIVSVAAPNLTPFFSHDLTDVYNSSTNPNGYWRNANARNNFTQLEDGWAHFEKSGVTSTFNYYFSTTNNVESWLKPSTTYTALIELRNVTLSGGTYAQAYASTGASAALPAVTTYTWTESTVQAAYLRTVTTGSDVTSQTFAANGCVQLRGTADSPQSLSCDLRISLYEGTYTGRYVPVGCIGVSAGSTTVPIDLQGHALRSLPDGTHDEMRVDSLGRVTMTQRVGSVTLDGSESWGLENSGKRISREGVTDARNPANVDTVADALCDHFKAETANRTWVGNVGVAIQNGKLRFADGSGAMTVASWTTWLAANPTTVLYPLATPQTIDLGTIDLPTPADTLWLDAAIVPTIDATWWTVGGIAGQQALDAEVTERQTLIRQFSGGVLAGYVGNAIAALVNAAGSFDVVRTAWSDGVPSILGTLARYAASGISLFDAAGNVLAEFASDHVRIGGDVPDGTGVESAVQFFDQTETHDTDLTASTYFDGDGSTYQTMQSTVNLSSTLADEGKAIDTGSSGTAALDLVNMLENGISDVGEQHNEVIAALVSDASYSDGDTTSHAAVRATASTTGGSGLSYAELIADALGIGTNESSIDYVVMRQVLCALLHPSATYTAGVGTWTNGHPNAWETAGYGVTVTETGHFTDYLDASGKGVGEFTALVGCTVRVTSCVTWVDSVSGRRSVGAFVNATRSGTTLSGGTEYSNSGLFYTGSNAKTAQLTPLILHLAAGNRLNFGKYAPASAVQSNQTYKMNWVTIEVLSVD